MDKVDAIVIGAGVIGLAVARELAFRGREVVILEAAEAIGSVTTARNSCVIHAGIYYPPGSAKARHCVVGRDLLYDYLRERALPFRQCGKVIVAAHDGQLEKLKAIVQRAQANSVDSLQWLTATQLAEKEPDVQGVAALFSPATGIIDVHEYIHSLLGDAEAHGAVLALRSPVTGLEATDAGFIVQTGGETPLALACRSLVNAAGLNSQHIARMLRGLRAEFIPKRHLAKGNYFSLGGRQPFRHLVYPVPEPGGLGVHATLDLAGKTRFGPDVEWVDTEEYAVDPIRAGRFYDAIRTYWPGLPDGALQPDYSGIRPKLTAAGEPDGDFIIQGTDDHGLPGLVNLYGIESPGLTASLSIAAAVAGKLFP